MSRKQISLTDPVEERAQAIITRRGFNGLSDMIATLVREEYERRGLTSGELKDSPTNLTAPQPKFMAERPVAEVMDKLKPGKKSPKAKASNG